MEIVIRRTTREGVLASGLPSIGVPVKPIKEALFWAGPSAQVCWREAVGSIAPVFSFTLRPKPYGGLRVRLSVGDQHDVAAGR